MTKMRFLLCCLVLLTSIVLVLTLADMETVYEWKYIDYVWDSEEQKQQAIQSEDYYSTQIVPMDVDKAQDGRVFVSFLGTWGAPAVLGTVSEQMGPSGPLIKPYPDWSYYGECDCDLIRNVYRIAIDQCQRLWVLDNGFFEATSPSSCGKLKCDPQLHVFDLKTDRLIDRIKIPEYIYRGPNDKTFLLATPIIETYGDKCDDTTVYIANTFGHALIIWNNGEWSRLEDPRFEPDECAENITSDGVTATWKAGIVTMDITPQTYEKEIRELYFHSLSSFDLYGAKTDDLKRTNDASTINFIDGPNVLTSQAVGMAFSSEGTLFMGITEDASIACWSRYKPFEPEYFEKVTQDRSRLQYLNGMKVIRGPTPDDDELWVLSNQFVKYSLGFLNQKEINFRILKGSVKELTDRTSCA